ncbi:MAG: LrgB family protein [Alphaproteobacteria bacterium]|nr:LrgB family protein [Alphaproteobacteria bacterium]
MIDFLSASPYFGVVLTLVMFGVAYVFHRRWPLPLTTPLFLATVFVILVLLATGIDYKSYNLSAQYLTYFLVPVTVCFAVPMYRQLPLLRKHAFSILVAILIGVICSVLSVIFICIFFGLGDVVARSLVSISVTTAIAIGITEQLGGVVALTVSSVIITGILGASVSGFVCRKIGLTNPMACGLAIGNASHAAGTTAAMRMGPIQGGLSSLAIVLSGVFTAVIAPLAIWLFFF